MPVESAIALKDHLKKLTDFANLGAYLATARSWSDWTQQELARASGLSQTAISFIETGKKWPTLRQLERLAHVLHLPLQWFLTGTEQAGGELVDLAFELHGLGISDLFVPEARVPGAFRPTEQVIALALTGDAVDPRIVEALPAVLAWRNWEPSLVEAFADLYDPRAKVRAGWLCDVVLTIQQNQGFPGGCRAKPRLIRLVHSVRPSQPPTVLDSLGWPGEGKSRPPLWIAWGISYGANLNAFRERAQRLHASVAKRVRRLSTERFP